MDSSTLILLLLILWIAVNYFMKCKSETFEQEVKMQTQENKFKKLISEKINLNDQEYPQKMDDKKIRIIVFLSKTCPACVNFDKNIHNKVKEQFMNNDNITIDKIYSGESALNDKMFNDFNVQLIPTCFVIDEMTGKTIKTNGVLPNQINDAVNKL